MKSDGVVRDCFRGELQIDRANGVIEFHTWNGQVRLLRITHLPDPIPPGTSIDLVALKALTSYTPAASEDSWPDAEVVKP